MAILRKLPTLNRTRSWWIVSNFSCLFYGMQDEYRNHLFIECPFSKELWGQILQNCGISRQVQGWNTEMQWAICRIKGKALISVVLRVVWSAYLYYLRLERNARMHGNVAKSVT